MRVFTRIVAYHLRDTARSRWLLIYAAFFALATDALLRFSDSPLKAGLALVSVVLLIVPLVSLMVGTMYVYAAREFTEVLLAQPIRRRALFLAQYVGIALPLSLAFAAGLVLPFAFHGAVGGPEGGVLLSLLAAGVGLSWIFAALAQLIAVRFDDRVRGLGLAIGAWLALTILYDGMVLVLATTLSSYPIERPLLVLMLLNPVDLARLALLLQFDVSALMGYTGALFRSFFDGSGALFISLGALLLWVAGPVMLGARHFGRKDF
jgi:Cu-processing system permease protein